MAHATTPPATALTAADLVARFGAMPLDRIRYDPPPGSATESDVIEIHDREDRLYELIDGILLEKTVGTYESYLAMLLGQLLGVHVRTNHLGIVLGADGILRLAPGFVRIPDVFFISWQRLPGRKVPRTPIADLAPDLAVEVISESNTQAEMERKLAEYFAAGVRQVWYVYHQPRREVLVYTAIEEHVVVNEDQQLDGGDLLPGFSFELKSLFFRSGPSIRILTSGRLLTMEGATARISRIYKDRATSARFFTNRFPLDFYNSSHATCVQRGIAAPNLPAPATDVKT